MHKMYIIILMGFTLMRKYMYTSSNLKKVFTAALPLLHMQGSHVLVAPDCKCIKLKYLYYPFQRPRSMEELHLNYLQLVVAVFTVSHFLQSITNEVMDLFPRIQQNNIASTMSLH